MLHFIHRIDQTNIGDLSCCPLPYFSDFERFKVMKHDIYNINFSKIAPDDLIILGGGGLFNCLEEWNQNINHLLELCPNVIAWACGFNLHHNTSIQTPIAFDRFKLLSIRDHNYHDSFNYVPCVSCFLPQLTRKYRTKRKIGLIEHKQFPLTEFEGERISNKAPLSEIIPFIGSSEIIITSSYHIWYWATLMKKKVILAHTFSEKFNYLPYPAVQYSGNLEQDIQNCQIYTNALKECRLANLLFFQQIKPYLKTCRKKSLYKYFRTKIRNLLYKEKA